MVLDALATAGAYLTEHAERAAGRHAVIASSPELQERERTKAATLSAAIHHALLERGSADGPARAVAQLATLAFANAYAEWVDTQGETDFATCLRAAIAAFQEIMATA